MRKGNKKMVYSIFCAIDIFSNMYTRLKDYEIDTFEQALNMFKLKLQQGNNWKGIKLLLTTNRRKKHNPILYQDGFIDIQKIAITFDGKQIWIMTVIDTIYY